MSMYVAEVFDCLISSNASGNEADLDRHIQIDKSLVADSVSL